ncbi:MAG: outer membrane lipoprotein-sorting protein [bacterium]|nr:outer membrane lipoprotein-sorting protein [bacterium]
MKRISLIAVSILLFSTQALLALTGDEIMDKNRALTQPKTVKSKVLMTINRNGGRTETKKFNLLSKKVNGDDRILMKFIKPTRMKFLSHAQKDGDTQQWIKRKSGKAKKIGSSDKGKRFVHSHFFYEDLGTPSIENYTYENLGDGDALGSPCYKVEAIKKKDKVYDKTILYVRKSDFFVIKTEFYQNGKMLKYLETHNIKTVKGIITPYKTIMYMAGDDQKSILEVQSIKYNKRISSRKFRAAAL